jgi:hypothetical protein
MQRLTLTLLLVLLCSTARAANHVETFLYDSSETTLYAFPSGQADFTNWASLRVAVTNTNGSCSVTLSDATYTAWAVFVGSSAPSSYDDAIGDISIKRDAAIAVLPTAAQVVTALLDTDTSDPGANKIGRAFHNLRQLFGAGTTGVPTAEAAAGFFANQPATEVELTEEQIDDIAEAIGEGTGFIAVDPDVIDASRTWNGEGSRANNVITVLDNFDGTLALKPDLNNSIISPEAGSITVTVTGAASVTPTAYMVNRDYTKAHVKLPQLTTTGTYTVVWTVGTVDGQTIPTTCTLKVQ